MVKNGSIKYTLAINLMKERYEGFVKISFTTLSKKETFLDFSGTELTSLYINNTKVENINWNKLFIILEEKYLKLD